MPYLGQMARSGSKEDFLAQLEAANLYTDSLTIPNSVISHLWSAETIILVRGCLLARKRNPLKLGTVGQQAVEQPGNWAQMD